MLVFVFQNSNQNGPSPKGICTPCLRQDGEWKQVKPKNCFYQKIREEKKTVLPPALWGVGERA